MAGPQIEAARDASCSIDSMVDRAKQATLLAADYSGRSGWPLPPAEMRGAVQEDFEPPRDMRIPPALRRWSTGQAAGEGAAAPG